MKKLIRILALPVSFSLVPLFTFTTAGAVSSSGMQSSGTPGSHAEQVQGGTMQDGGMQGSKGQYMQGNKGQYIHGSMKYGDMQGQQGRYKGEPGAPGLIKSQHGESGQLMHEHEYNNDNWGYGGEWHHGYGPGYG